MFTMRRSGLCTWGSGFWERIERMGQRILGADCADGWWGVGRLMGVSGGGGGADGVSGFWERIARMVGGGLGCLMGAFVGGGGADGAADFGSGLRGWLAGFWLFDGGVWRWGWNGWGNGFWERIARMVGGVLVV